MIRVSRFSTTALSSAAAAAAPSGSVTPRASAVAAAAAARRRPLPANSARASAPSASASTSTATKAAGAGAATGAGAQRRSPIRVARPPAPPAAVKVPATARAGPTRAPAAAAAPLAPEAEMDDFPLPTEGIEDYTRLRAPARPQPTPSPPLTALPGREYTPLPDAGGVLPGAGATAADAAAPSASRPSHPGELGAKTMGDGYAFLGRVPGEQPVEDWTTSFRGLSEAPFDKDVAEALLRPLEMGDVEIKPDGLLYLPEIKYRRTLNAAFGPGGWGMAPRGETHVGPRIVSREWGLVCLGRLVAIARGEQEYFDPSGIPTATEACKSNALMRCCKDLGIASELWDPRFIREFKTKYCTESMVEHVTQKKRRKLWRKKDQKFEYPYKEIGPVPK